MRRAPASGGVGRGGKTGSLDCPGLLRIKDLGESGSHCIPPPPRPQFRGAAPTSNARAVQEASRSSAKAGSIATLRGAPSALLCEWDPPRPCSAGAAAAAVSGGPALAPLRLLSPAAAEETDGAGAPRLSSEPGESADPAHPIRHPRETPSGAAGELRALGPGGARAPGAHRCGVLASSAPHAPPRPPAPRAPQAKGRVWSRERDGAGSGKGES